ncbi:TPA: hypothetical protein DCG86_04315 [Candidatus Marinimicrobia bacterium]|nr:hypothetical protein [Candidatus Neomarinimicrobiota bacterium]HBY17761.1 hypothetical protein [Candidatus Neomarinimicrobiota bacterium]
MDFIQVSTGFFVTVQASSAVMVKVVVVPVSLTTLPPGLHLRFRKQIRSTGSIRKKDGRFF